MRGMANIEGKMRAGLELQGQIAADKMASQAKAGAKWTDRTGHARGSITGYVYWEAARRLRIGLSAGMDYSPYLELANNKKYAILYPTVRASTGDIMSAMAKILK